MLLQDLTIDIPIGLFVNFFNIFDKFVTESYRNAFDENQGLEMAEEIKKCSIMVKRRIPNFLG